VDNNFLSSVCTAGPGQGVEISTLFRAWVAWAMDHGLEIGAEEAFNRWARSHYATDPAGQIICGVGIVPGTALATLSDAKKALNDSILSLIGTNHELYVRSGELSRVEVWDLRWAPAGVSVFTKRGEFIPCRCAPEARDKMITAWRSLYEIHRPHDS